MLEAKFVDATPPCIETGFDETSLGVVVGRGGPCRVMQCWCRQPVGVDESGFGLVRPSSPKEQRDRLTGELNWKKKPPKSAACSIGCDRTLCICGSCMDSSVPANIMYGYITAACGVPNFLMKRMAFDLALAEKQKKDPGVRDPRGIMDSSSAQLASEFDAIWPPHDQRAVEFGYMLGTEELADKQRFCAMFRALGSDMQGPDDPNCSSASCCS